MSTKQAQVDRAPSLGEAAEAEKWDEEQIEAALKRLKEIHIKVRNMRTAISDIVQPMYEDPYPQPEGLFQSVETSVEKAFKDVAKLKELMEREDTKRILKRARRSREDKPTGINPWYPQDDLDWLATDFLALSRE